MSFLQTALYYKNVPPAERIVRLMFGAGLATVPALWSTSIWMSIVLITNGVFLAATAFVGFCPACYLAGRRLVARRHSK